MVIMCIIPHTTDSLEGLTAMRRSLLTAAFEAITQQDGLLFRELSAHLQDFIATGNITDRALRAYPIDKTIMTHLGLSVDFGMDEAQAYIPNAWVVPPQVTKNHPLVADFWRFAMSDKEGIAAIRQSKNGFIEGTVDRVKAKVSGDFSKFVSEIRVTKGLFDTKIGMTAQEIAAIILHECGHLFTYFECLGDQITTNYQIHQVTKQLLGTADIPVRVKILREAETTMDVKVDNIEAASRMNNKELLQTVLLEAKVRSHRSEFGSYYYDLRNWESLSDQFAARHQCHLALATALDKMYRFAGHQSIMSTPRFLMSEVLKVTLIVIGAFIALPLIVFILIQDPFLDTYDRPAERVRRIREDLVSALRDPGLGDDKRKAILSDITAIDDVLARLNDRTTLWEAVWKFLSPTIRGQQARVQDLKALEELANNELYVHAAALRTHA
jgi:hypothetical protein